MKDKKVSKCCGSKIDYGLGKIGGIIRCTFCGLICEEQTAPPKIQDTKRDFRDKGKCKQCPLYKNCEVKNVDL